ncbi:MAG: SRPBCC family protein [Gammaproteobacteria bacterium]|nr:SRPBCC family protein [Gammaproteobacteria bacterium]
MFRKIAYFTLALFAVFVIVGFLLPREVHVERRITIDRPPSTVFTLVNGFERFESWSPWAPLDPEAVYTYSGPASGVGAKLAWSGDPRLVGSGWQEIIESQPYTLVRMQLDFEQQGRAQSYFQLVGVGRGTELIWGFDTDLVEGQGVFGGLLARYFGLFFDRWIGSDYERGLASLKRLAESLPATDFGDLAVEVVDVPAGNMLYVAGNALDAAPDMASRLATAYAEIREAMADGDLSQAGPPMAITQRLANGRIELLAAIPVEGPVQGLEGEVRAGRAPSGKAVRFVHRGPYEQMAPGYEKLAAYLAAHGLEEGDVSWEQYVSDPSDTPADEMVTHIYALIQASDTAAEPR